MPTIELKHVYKIFGPEPQQALARVREGLTKEEVLEQTGHTVGLNDVNLTIRPGETFVVMGLSGSGKSTLIRHLNRLIDPTAGEVLVDGVNILDFSARQLLDFRRHQSCMVFQSFALFPHRSVLANVAYGLQVRGIGRVQRDEQARRWIEAVGLQGYEKVYPSQLSGGMQQRVGLARALASNTDLMLMDEAFSALDPLIRREMQDQLIDLQRELHKTIVFITHDLDEALRLGDTIAILNAGRVVQVGAAEDIVLNPADAYVAAFLKDVNRGLVLTASTIMVRPAVVVRDDEPVEAVRKRLRRVPYSVAYVVDEERRLSGAVDEAGLKEAEEGTGVAHLMSSCTSVNEDGLLDEVLPLTLERSWPVAVVDDAGRLRGIIPRRQAVAALVESAEVAEG